MLNQIVLCGKLFSIRDESVVLICTTPDSNETKYIEVFMSENILNNCKQYLKGQDLIGIKGYIDAVETTPKGYNHKQIKLMVVATKVSFLSSVAKEAMTNVESD